MQRPGAGLDPQGPGSADAAPPAPPQQATAALLLGVRGQAWQSGTGSPIRPGSGRGLRIAGLGRPADEPPPPPLPLSSGSAAGGGGSLLGRGQGCGSPFADGLRGLISSQAPMPDLPSPCMDTAAGSSGTPRTRFLLLQFRGPSDGAPSGGGEGGRGRRGSAGSTAEPLKGLVRSTSSILDLLGA